jgi:hypothetical protein
MAGSNRGEREADRIINSLNLPTKIQGTPSDTPLTEQSFFDVYELELNKATKEPPILISGNDAQIVLQTSLINALNQLLEFRGVSYFDFAEWVEQFENGFSSFTTGTSKELKKIWETMPYVGIAKENRPKIVEIKVNANKKVSVTYKAVQFYPDRKNINEWVIFTGNYREIAQQIQIYWNQKTAAVGMSSNGGALPYLKGKPLIKLYFVQDAKDIETNAKGNLKKPVRGEISFRLMDKTDDPTATGDKLTKADLENYAKAIATELGGDKPFVWEKGKMICSYRNRKQGFEGWYAVKSKAAGVALISKILAILKLPVDKTKIHYGETDDAAKAYPDTAAKATILGEEVSLPLQRPLVNVRFQSAEIQLPTIKKTIPLVRLGMAVYKA